MDISFESDTPWTGEDRKGQIEYYLRPPSYHPPQTAGGEAAVLAWRDTVESMWVFRLHERSSCP